jgi:hypothetical protein
MRVLQEAADNAQEIIGGGLVDALALLAGEGNTVEPLAESMSEFSIYVSDAIVGVALLIDKLKKVPGLGTQNALTSKSFLINPTTTALAILKRGLDYVSKTGEEFRTPGMGGYPSSALGPGYIDPNIAARKKAEAEAAKREAARLKREKESAAAAAKALAAQKKSALEQKKANALTKAAQTLDLTRIGIAAALKNQISETDRLSLNLQLALLDENDVLATKLSKQLETAVERQNQLNALLLATPKAPNPYSNWIPPSFTLSTPTLTPTATPTLTPTATPTLTPTATETLAATTASEAAALIALITETADALGVTTTTPITTTTATTTTATAITTQLIEATDSLASALEFSATDSSFLASSTDAMLELLDAFNSAQAAQAAAESVAAAVDKVGDIYIKVEVDGTEIASSAKTELTNQSLSGSFVNVNRLGRFANVPTAL